IAESALAIVGEVVSAVHHCLLGVPGAKRGGLRRGRSHPVAAAQCERLLGAARRGGEGMGGDDNAGAAGGGGGRRGPPLPAFAAAGLNLTKLESRPDRTTPWEYLFYLDVEARAADGAMAAALRDLEAQGAVVMVLGSYPRFTPPV